MIASHPLVSKKYKIIDGIQHKGSNSFKIGEIIIENNNR